jgi:hypothetical protein
MKTAPLVALDAWANEVFDGPLTIEAIQGAIEKYAPETSEQCQPTAGNQLDTTEAIKLRVA